MGTKLKTSAVAVAIVALYLFGAPHMMLSCSDIGDHAMKKLRACPAAVEALGDDIDISYGMTCGSMESQGGLERATVWIPVAGSKASGEFHYSGDRVGNSLRFSAQLTVGDRSLDIGTCSPAAGGVAASRASEAAHTGQGSFDGKVSRSTHPNVAAGGFCNGSFTLRGARKPAQLLIKCDGVVVYRGQPAARNEAGDPDDPDDDQLTLSDGDTSDVDQSPALEFSARLGRPDGQAGSATVTDVAYGNQPAFDIEIAL